MNVRENVPLARLTTMRLGGAARYVVEITTDKDLIRAIQLARDRGLPWFMMGGGSNIIAGDDGFDGVVMLNRIKGFDRLRDDDESATFRIGAGEIWDTVVARLCDFGLSGVECMSAIPGVAGATPVQNVGAFGQEIADTLVELTAYDVDSDQFVTLGHDDCQFAYRNSIFKNPPRRRYCIASITLRLSKKPLSRPFYAALEKYLDDHQIEDHSPGSLRAAVIAIRAEKLPPLNVASAGSFFKNPIVSRAVADQILADFPDAPHWDAPGDRVKLAAGWLIDRAGLGDYSGHGFQLFPKNALVVTNLNAKSADDLEQFKTEIVARVRDKFGVELEQEPESL